MIDKKLLIASLERKILFYENEKKDINNQDKLRERDYQRLITIDFAIRELENIIESIGWGMYDAK